MKFYSFDSSDFEYYALIWAKDEDKAIEHYKETVCECVDKDCDSPVEVDIDEVLEKMIEGGFDGDKEHMAIGHIGRLYEIISNKEPKIVLLDGNL